MNTQFRSRKPKAFQNDGLFFGLRMFSTTNKFDENQVEKGGENDKKQITGENMVRHSIDHHFYHFGEENGPAVLSFSHDEYGLKLNLQPFPLRIIF